ncbi:uncharacterized protein TNCV_2043381 [Trichonephila clavipes]|nr:uncharacterized protein TNCV_2043381 [Trichonephila clavipes]
MEIRTGSSDSLQYGRKKGSDVKRELEEKGTSFFKIRVRDTQIRPINADHLSDLHLVLGLRPVEGLKETKIKKQGINDDMNLSQEGQKGRLRRVLNIECIKELCRQMILIVFCQKIERKAEQKKKVSPSRCVYNLRPRGGRGVESRLAMEMKIQQECQTKK